MLILKAVSLDRLHGYGVLIRLQQLTGGRLQIQQGSLSPALYRLQRQKLIEYTIGKEIDVGTIKAEGKPNYEQVIDKSIVDEAIKRNGGPWTGDPRWY